jgi:hypothetical protein
MLVANTGIRSYNPASNSWIAPPGATGLGNPGSVGYRNTVTCLSGDDQRVVAGVLVQHDEVVTEETSPKHFLTRVKSTSKGGGLAIYDFQGRRWRDVLPKGDLPSPPAIVRFDGKDIWAAGSGYVAVVDGTAGVVRKLCNISIACRSQRPVENFMDEVMPRMRSRSPQAKPAIVITLPVARVGKPVLRFVVVLEQPVQDCAESRLLRWRRGR